VIVLGLKREEASCFGQRKREEDERQKSLIRLKSWGRSSPGERKGSNGTLIRGSADFPLGGPVEETHLRFKEGVGRKENLGGGEGDPTVELWGKEE